MTDTTSLQPLTDADFHSPAFTDWLACTDSATEFLPAVAHRLGEARNAAAHRLVLREIEEYSMGVERAAAAFIAAFADKLPHSHPLIQMIQSIEGTVAAVRELACSEGVRLAAAE